MAAVASLAAAPAQASKPSGAAPPVDLPADVRASMQAQVPLVDASDRIQAAVARERAAGFTGVAIENGKLVLRWKRGAAVPAAVTAVVNDARRTAKLEVRSAPYSYAELKSAADRIVAQVRKANPGGPVFGVGIPTDGGGVVAIADRAVAATVPGSLARAAGVQVPVEIAVQPRPQQTSRISDSRPFWGGARIRNYALSFYECSTAFAVESGGFHFLVTAAHCVSPGDPVFNGDITQFIGYAGSESNTHDVAVVGTPLAQGRIYDGPVGAGEFSKPVIGWGYATAGQHVCVSGARTGAVCNIFNSGFLSQTVCAFDFSANATVCTSDLVYATQRDGQNIVQGGDSGGPVFDLRNPNWNNVVARGVISKGNGAGGSYVYYGKFSNVVGDFGVTPLTSS